MANIVNVEYVHSGANLVKVIYDDVQYPDYYAQIDGATVVSDRWQAEQLETWLQTGTPTDYATARTLDRAKEEKMLAIDDGFMMASSSPVTTAKGTFSADLMAFQLINSYVTAYAAGWTPPGGFTWDDVSGNDVAMAAIDMRNLFETMSTQWFQARKTRKDLIAQVFAATDISTVDAIPDWQ